MKDLDGLGMELFDVLGGEVTPPEDVKEPNTDNDDNTGQDDPVLPENTDNDNSDEGQPGGSSQKDDTQSPEGDDQSTGQEGGSEESPNNPYSSFASALSEEGLLPSLDLKTDKIEDFDGLAEAFKKEITEQVKNTLVNKVGLDGYEALEKGISLAELQQHQQTVDTLDSIDDKTIESNLDLAQRIIMQDYINQGMDEAKARRILSRTAQQGDEVLVQDAKESLNSLKQHQAEQFEKQKEQRENEAKERVKRQEKLNDDIKKAVYDSDEIIKGLSISKKMQDETYKLMTTIVGKNDQGVAENKLIRDRRENPIEFDAKLYFIYAATKGFTDLSFFNKKVQTKAANTLETVLKNNKFTQSSGSDFGTDSDSYSGIGDGHVLNI